MKEALIAFNDSFLLLGASMYFGTGWSTELFSVPIYPHLNAQNYTLHFVPQIKRAVPFFFTLATLMWIAAGIMIITEIRTLNVILPSIVLAMLVASTILTTRFIFPINNKLAKGVADDAELKHLLGKWIRLNRLRLSMWTSEWVAMATFFGIHVR